MNYGHIFAITIIASVGFFISDSAFGQIDQLSEIKFLQTGILHTDSNEFQISNEMDIKEFASGEIIRISGQTIEGFPYLIYSTSFENELETRGKIFIGNDAVNLIFTDIIEPEEKEGKEDNVSILVKYSQREYTGREASFTIKLFDPEINKSNDFDQNYGMISNTDIEITVNDDGVEIFSDNGTVNDKGVFETGFIMPKDNVKEYTVEIVAENDVSESSKILQMFNLGAEPKLKK